MLTVPRAIAKLRKKCTRQPVQLHAKYHAVAVRACGTQAIICANNIPYAVGILKRTRAGTESKRRLVC